MKLHLPVSLCRALAVLFASAAFAAETVTLNTLQPSPDLYYGDTLYEIEDSNIYLDGNWAPDFSDFRWPTMHWISTVDGAQYTLSGFGDMGNLNGAKDEEGIIMDLTLVISGNSTFVIESGVHLKDVDIEAARGAEVVIEGAITKTFFELYAWGGSIVDIRQTRINNTYWWFDIGGDSKMLATTLEISPYSCLSISGASYAYDDAASTSSTAYLNGNLVLRGGSLGFKSEQRFHWDLDPMSNRFGAVYVAEGATLAVSGTINISAPTPILYHIGDYSEGSDYDASLDRYNNGIDFSAPLFSCSSINESGLSMLEPYLHLYVYDSEYEEYTWYKPLLDKEYYAVAGGDGRVYVYLGDAGAPAIPPGAIQVGKDQEVELGTNADTTPSPSKPVYLQSGGKADASALDNSLLNNQVIMGTGGELATHDGQTMILTGAGSVSYSIVSAGGTGAAADLVIGEAGKDVNLQLKGATYDSDDVQVNGGVVTISSSTTLGRDAASSGVTVADAAKLTNNGIIKAGMQIGQNCAVLNENIIEGTVDLGAGSVLTNNGEIRGKLTASGKVYGSGSFGDTVLNSSALLHVGNSPGYQKHTSLTIDRGATLSFSVDGDTAATATNHGSGTYSVLEAGTLTINPGTGTVTVLVDVTMGIVSAEDPSALTLTLMKVTDLAHSDAVEADFTLQVTDTAGLLEPGTSLTYDSATGEMQLHAAVSKAALAALMDSNSANVANTMWASANAVQEMVRTAENQFLVGMPGQTTFWGAGLGSFMNVGGEQGFTSNSYGYAVGLQHAFTEKFRAGVALGQMFGTFKSDDNQLKVDQNAMMPVLTAQYVTKTGKISSVTVSGHIAYGIVENEAETYQAGTTGTADWEDEVFNIGVKVAWNMTLGDHVTTSLFTGLTYQQVEQDAFTEHFTGGKRSYRDGSMSSLSVPMGITIRGVYEMEGTNVFAPELTLAYIADISRDNPTVNTNVYGFTRTGEGSNLGRGAFMMQVGANWMFNSTMSVGAFYALEARSNQVNQSFNAALRCSF